MSRLRASAWTIAAVLISVHAGVLLTQHGTESASVWGDWIDAVAPFTAAVVCWLVAQRSGPFGKRVWRLVSLSALLTSIGQCLYTYSYDYKHAALGTLWPSDFLVFFWIVPAVMTLFLSVGDSDSGLEWLRFFDFVQVCTLALAIELTQIYVPSRWQASRAIHAIAGAPCGAPVLRPVGGHFPGAWPSQRTSRRESILPAHGRIPGGVWNRAERYAQRAGWRPLCAGDVARPDLDHRLRRADCAACPVG